MAGVHSSGPNQIEAEIEYGRTVIQLAGETARQVYLRVTGVVGLGVLFLTQLPFAELTAMPLWARWVLVVGLAAAASSAAFYFRYLSTLNLSRLDMASYMKDGKLATWEKSGRAVESSGKRTDGYSPAVPA